MSFGTGKLGLTKPKTEVIKDEGMSIDDTNGGKASAGKKRSLEEANGHSQDGHESLS